MPFSLSWRPSAHQEHIAISGSKLTMIEAGRRQLAVSHSTVSRLARKLVSSFMVVLRFEARPRAGLFLSLHRDFEIAADPNLLHHEITVIAHALTAAASGIAFLGTRPSGLKKEERPLYPR